MKNLFKKVSIVLIFLFSHASYANFELASSYYNQKDFEHAYKEFMEAAKFGDHDAQNNLGVMYYRGEYVTQDKPMAYAWMAIAAQGEPYKSNGLHQKIFNKLSNIEQKIAEEKYNALKTEFSDQAIEKRLTPTLSSENNRVQKQRPLIQIAPEYPSEMLKQGKVGYVDLVVTIDKNGFTKDQFVYFSPSPDFSKSALRAVKRWQYEPLKINGKAVDVTGVKLRIQFFIRGAEVDEKQLIASSEKLKEQAMSGNSRDKLTYGFFLEVLPAYTKNSNIIGNPNEWYLKSAADGNSTASYFLGRNILNGNMCTTDGVQSMGWLLKAANAGLADAQYMLAIEAFSGARFEKNEEKATYWLTKASSNNYIPAKLKYAWILSTHSKQERRDGNLASELISKIDDDYVDKQTLYQTRAAVAAENGKFEEALKWQKKAIEDAINLKLPTDYLQQELDTYKSDKPWREEI